MRNPEVASGRFAPRDSHSKRRSVATGEGEVYSLCTAECESEAPSESARLGKSMNEEYGEERQDG